MNDNEYYAIKTMNGRLVTWTAKKEMVDCYQNYIDHLINQDLFKPELVVCGPTETFEARNCRLWMLLKEKGSKIVKVNIIMTDDGVYQIPVLEERGIEIQKKLDL